MAEMSRRRGPSWRIRLIARLWLAEIRAGAAEQLRADLERARREVQRLEGEAGRWDIELARWEREMEALDEALRKAPGKAAGNGEGPPPRMGDGPS